MSPVPHRTFPAATLAVILALAVPLTGVSAAAKAPASALFTRPSMTLTGKLSHAQVLKLERHSNQPVLIVLKDQFSGLEGPARQMLASRNAAIAAAQAPVVSELRSVHAGHVLAFHLIDALKATVSTAEEARLRANPAVESVQADSVIPAPQLVRTVSRRERLALSKARRAAKRSDCSNQNVKPLLEPQALQLTNTAFSDPTTPQAQNLFTGKGVTVAIVSGPIAPYNPDFIRPDGTPVITDFESFGGDPPFTPGGGGGWDSESFLDMSSVAAQGNEIFNINDWANNLGTQCETMRIRGMAPGANVMWLDAVGQNGETDSNFVQAVQYAVDNGANVISESFGGNPNNDTGVDAVTLVDDAATRAGVSVVVSSGDSGSNNSLGTAATSGPVISAGATTSFQEESLIGRLKAQGNTGWIDNNVSSFSAGGINQNGTKTVDVVAPGAFGFIDCTPDPSLFPGCTDYVTGVPLNFQIEGGTSESAPLTAGEAALVIQAYKSTHHSLPSAATVKSIIMSTATDLGDPSWEQGAGLINSYQAVLAAKSWKLSAKSGDSLITSPSDLTAAGNPGASKSMNFTVTNNTAASQKVVAEGRILGANRTLLNTSVKNLKVASGAERQCAFSYSYAYYYKCPPEATVHFTVPSGVSRFSADIGWNTVTQPFSEVELRLVDPAGKYAGNTEPSDLGPPVTSSGYGHVDIAHPTPGTWTAQVKILGFTPQVPTYSGDVLVRVTASTFTSFGKVAPAAAILAPGQSHQFTLTTKLPATAGDTNADVVVKGKSASAGIIPVILRTFIPTNGSGGSFSGSLLGANGRAGAIWSTAYEFNVGNGVRTMGLSIKLADSHDNIQGVLVDPEGYASNVQSTADGYDTNSKSLGFGLPNSYRNTIQLFQIYPLPGRWRLLLEIIPNVSGTMISTPFTGSIKFNASTASGGGLPKLKSQKLAAGSTHTYVIKIKNVGNTVKDYFVDPRLAVETAYAFNQRVHLPLNRPPFDAIPTLLVPPESSQIVGGAESIGTNKTPSVPIMFTAGLDDGGAPYGLGSDPELISTSDFNVATSDFTAGLSFSTNYEVPNGLWTMTPATIGPWPYGEPNTIASVGAIIVTAAFDPAVSSSTGDLWETLGFGAGHYKPLVLNPGQTGSIRVTIKPDQQSGTLVQGAVIVDTFAATGGFPYSATSAPITWSGEETDLIPYQYTVK